MNGEMIWRGAEQGKHGGREGGVCRVGMASTVGERLMEGNIKIRGRFSSMRIMVKLGRGTV